MALLQLKDGKFAKAVVSPKDDQGVERAIDGLLTWSVVEGDAVLEQVSEDTKTAYFSQGTFGVVSKVSAVADADLDADEVREILFEGEILWVENPVEATVLEGEIVSVDSIG